MINPIDATDQTVYDLFRAAGFDMNQGSLDALPIPPLDGGTVLAGLLPERLAAGLDRIRPYGFVLLYALMFSGGFSVIVGTPYFYLRSWLL